jgi:hypothetical protein
MAPEPSTPPTKPTAAAAKAKAKVKAKAAAQGTGDTQPDGTQLDGGRERSVPNMETTLNTVVELCWKLEERVAALEEERKTLAATHDSMQTQYAELQKKSQEQEKCIKQLTTAVADQKKQLDQQERLAADTSARNEQNTAAWVEKLKKTTADVSAKLEKTVEIVEKVGTTAHASLAELAVIHGHDKARKTAEQVILFDSGAVTLESDAAAMQAQAVQVLTELGCDQKVEVQRVRAFPITIQRSGASPLKKVNLVVTLRTATEVKEVVDAAHRKRREAVQAAKQQQAREGGNPQPVHTPRARYDLIKEYVNVWRAMQAQKMEWAKTRAYFRVRYDLEAGVPKLRTKEGERSPWVDWTYAAGKFVPASRLA